MGLEFQPLYADVIEAMKVAEAFEACFPNPEQKIKGIAGTIFNSTPPNTILFIHDDVLEGILLVNQQAGVRPDIVIINAARIMDRSYMQIVLDRYAKELNFGDPELSKNVFKMAEQRKAERDTLFQNLQGEGEQIKAEGPQLLSALSLLMMQEIGREAPNRPALFFPSRWTREPIEAWSSLSNRGIFFTWEKLGNSSDNTIAEWEGLLDALAPAGSPVHVAMANAIRQSVYAAVDILNAQGEKEVSDKLLGLWNQRSKSIIMISGKDIEITKEKKMVQQIK